MEIIEDDINTPSWREDNYYIEAAFPEGITFKNFISSTLPIDRTQTVLVFNEDGITMCKRSASDECLVYMEIRGKDLLEYVFMEPLKYKDSTKRRHLCLDIAAQSSKNAFAVGKKTNRLNLIYKNESYLTLEFQSISGNIHGVIPVTRIRYVKTNLPTIKTNIYRCNSSELQNIFTNAFKNNASLQISSISYNTNISSDQGIRFTTKQCGMDMGSEDIERDKIKDSYLNYETPDRVFNVTILSNIVKALSSIIKNAPPHIIKINGTNRHRGTVKITCKLGTYSKLKIFLKNGKEDSYRS